MRWVIKPRSEQVWPIISTRTRVALDLPRARFGARVGKWGAGAVDACVALAVTLICSGTSTRGVPDMRLVPTGSHKSPLQHLMNMKLN